jgi:hypothetical protein
VQNPVSPPANINVAVVDLNAGILDNVDNLGGGNFVTVDGTDFLYKATNETAKELSIIVSYGKRFYQFFDEGNNQYYDADTKLDDRYKLKFLLKWFEDIDGEAVEYTMTLSTTSAIQFINYVKELAKSGIGVGQVVTKCFITRETSNDGKQRYSRVNFECLGSVETVQDNTPY